MQAKEPKVAADVAEAEFHRFCEMMDLDIGTDGMGADEVRDFEGLKRRILAAMCEGTLSINQNGEPVFRPKKSGPTVPAEMTFAEPKGSAYMAMDLRKKGHDVSKMYAVYAEITGVPAKAFAEMANRDLKVVQAIVTVFLA